MNPWRCLRICRQTLPFAVIAAVTACIGLMVLQNADRAGESAKQAVAETTDQEARAAVLALESTVSHTLDAIDSLHGLAQLVIQARRNGDQPMERDTLAQLALSNGGISGELRQVAAIAPSGYLDWSTLEPDPPPTYLGDREHFKSIAGGTATSFISDPLEGRVSRRRTIQFSKGTYGPADELLGVSVVSVDPAAFSGLAAGIGVAGNDTIAVQRRDGMILARSRGHEGIIPADGKVLRKFLQAPEGSFQAISAIDGVLRSIAWRRLDDAGLIVTVGLDLQTRLDRLAPTIARDRRQAVATCVLLGFLGLALMAGWYWRDRLAVQSAGLADMRRSEHLFRQIAENLPDMIRLIDWNGIIRYASPAAKAITGVPPEQVVGRHVLHFLHPDDHGMTAFTRLDRDATARQGRAEVRLVRSDGSIVTVQTTLRILPADPARPDEARIVSSTRDVTAQREAEATLRQLKDELDTVLRATSGILFRSEMAEDRKVRAIFLSDSSEAITGFSVQDSLGPGFFQSQLHPGDEMAMQEHFQRVRRFGSSSIQYRFRHSNGQWLWLHATVRAADRNGDGEQCFVGYVRDITHRREQDIQAGHNAKMAILGEMTTGMAHEVNQPLAAISMAAQNAIATLDTDKPIHRLAARKLDRIIEQVDRAARVIDHMRSSGGVAEPSRGSIDVASAISGVVATLDARLLQANIAVETSAGPDVPSAFGDPSPLEQVLINLAGNAVDAITMQEPPLEPARRRIALTASADRGDVVIAVVDHAGGIPEAVRDRLFEPFFTTKPAGTGTGLGLSISHGIITRMGGSLTARNAGDGAVFEIRLPSARSA